MIDYKEMENVIQALNEYVLKLQKISSTQQKLDDSIKEFITIKSHMEIIKETIDKYTKTIETLENKHEDIKSQFDTVLQDYKKLHSAFELLDIELKKIGLQNEKFDKSVAELKTLSQNIQNDVKEINLNQNQLFDFQKKSSKKINIWLGIITSLIWTVLILGIIKLFI